MNCNKCKFHESIPGDAHVSCTMLPIQSRMYAVVIINLSAKVTTQTGIEVVCEPHGVDSGWCNWPINYDPIWIKSCNQFVEKD
jgi:hypothetical protein